MNYINPYIRKPSESKVKKKQRKKIEKRKRNPYLEQNAVVEE